MLSEIRDDIKAIDVGPRAIRNFGVTFFLVFSGVGGFLALKGNPGGYIGVGGGVLFLILGLWLPTTLKGLYKVWMGLAVVLGFFMSRVILCVLYHLVITPIGLILRLLGKDILDRRLDRKTSSYWIKKEDKSSDKKRYEKMF